VEARVHDDPFAPEPHRQVGVRAQVLVDGGCHVRRELGDVDAGQRVQPEMDIVARAGVAHGPDAVRRPPIQVIGSDVGVEVEVVEGVTCGPGQGLLELSRTCVEADPVPQRHGLSSRVTSVASRQPVEVHLLVRQPHRIDAHTVADQLPDYL
jgi:hypothetical protein